MGSFTCFSLFGDVPTFVWVAQELQILRDWTGFTKLLKPVLFYQLTFLVKHLESANQLFEDTSEKCLCIGFRGHEKYYGLPGFWLWGILFIFEGDLFFLYILREKWEVNEWKRTILHYFWKNMLKRIWILCYWKRPVGRIDTQAVYIHI